MTLFGLRLLVLHNIVFGSDIFALQTRSTNIANALLSPVTTQYLQKPRAIILQSSKLDLNMEESHGKDDGAGQRTEPSRAIGQMRGGLVFLKTTDRASTVRFYTERIGMELWLEQPEITILSHGNMLLGFHDKPDEIPEVAGMYTFVYPAKEEVDAMHSRLADIADGPPRVNDRYKIYQFFARDPEGRKLEFQAFLHPLSVVSSQVG